MRVPGTRKLSDREQPSVFLGLQLAIVVLFAGLLIGDTFLQLGHTLRPWQISAWFCILCTLPYMAFTFFQSARANKATTQEAKIIVHRECKFASLSLPFAPVS